MPGIQIELIVLLKPLDEEVRDAQSIDDLMKWNSEEVITWQGCTVD